MTGFEGKVYRAWNQLHGSGNVFARILANAHLLSYRLSFQVCSPDQVVHNHFHGPMSSLLVYLDQLHITMGGSFNRVEAVKYDLPGRGDSVKWWADLKQLQIFSSAAIWFMDNPTILSANDLMKAAAELKGFLEALVDGLDCKEQVSAMRLRHFESMQEELLKLDLI